MILIVVGLGLGTVGVDLGFLLCLVGGLVGWCRLDTFVVGLGDVISGFCVLGWFWVLLCLF